jgi:hypothetical protein
VDQLTGILSRKAARYVVDKVGECIAAVGKEVEKAGKGIESHN